MQKQVLSGVFKGGVVVLDDAAGLAEGTRVEVVAQNGASNGEEPLSPFEFTPEEREEFEMWDRASDAAWAMIDEWEREEGISPEDMVKSP